MAGTVLGILGPTGSGKSTLTRTLARMADPPADTVFVHGIPAAAWDLQELRGLFGMVPQDSYLFSDSIKNNIAYGLSVAGSGDGGSGDGEKNAPGSTGADRVLEDAAHRSAIDIDLPGFADGWETAVGERGLTLSGGQKQRVSIARALAIAPEILVLDDALSAVDAETERRIVRFVLEERRERRNAGGGGIAIIVSHRISTLMNADRVIVLERGKITEEGPPAVLAKQGGFFARMAAMQQHEIEDTAASGGEPALGGRGV
jgi:ATP-binding cassette subfamily B protein